MSEATHIACATADDRLTTGVSGYASSSIARLRRSRDAAYQIQANRPSTPTDDSRHRAPLLSTAGSCRNTRAIRDGRTPASPALIHRPERAGLAVCAALVVAVRVALPPGPGASRSGNQICMSPTFSQRIHPSVPGEALTPTQHAGEAFAAIRGLTHVACCFGGARTTGNAKSR